MNKITFGEMNFQLSDLGKETVLCPILNGYRGRPVTVALPKRFYKRFRASVT